MPLEPQAEALLKKLVDSGVQPFETMTLAESRPELTAPPQVRFSSRLTIGWPSSHSLRRALTAFPPVLSCLALSGHERFGRREARRADRRPANIAALDTITPGSSLTMNGRIHAHGPLAKGDS